MRGGQDVLYCVRTGPAPGTPEVHHVGLQSQDRIQPRPRRPARARPRARGSARRQRLQFRQPWIAHLLAARPDADRAQRGAAAEPHDDGQAVSAPVGSFRPNAWGLFDMHGNVAEWTSSADLPYPFRYDDPRHSDAKTRKIARGGSWYHRADLSRSASRLSFQSWQRVFNVGFRVVCEAD